MKTTTLLIVIAGCTLATLAIRGPSVSAHPRRPLERARCLSAYGTTACGYDCQAAYGKVQCARTPAGACLAAYGSIKCWDPPARRHRRGRWPRRRATCQAAYGRIACGYGCVAAYGQVQCADRPGGTCQAAYGRITCVP